MKDSHKKILEIMGGYVSRHLEGALDLYFTHKYTVYRIYHVETGKFYVGVYNYLDEAQDIQWHFIHTRGTDSVGWAIRDEGMEFFKFETLGRFDRVKHAEFFAKSLIKEYKKKYENYRL